MDKKIYELSLERVWRTYEGGERINKVCPMGVEAKNYPELWIASCTKARNPKEHSKVGEGLSKVKDKELTLKEVIEAKPESLLGSDHHNRYGASLGILAKVLDSKERLTIQWHPTISDAKVFFNSEFGKTEAWYFLDNGEENQEETFIYLGFKEGTTKEEFIKKFELQDNEGMLAMLNKIPVKSGDLFLVEGGVPHALGKNNYLIEIQEPTDYTIRVERTTPNGLTIDDFSCHQGLGFDNMFKLLKHEPLSADEVIKRWKLLPRLKESSSNITYYALITSENTKRFTLEKAIISGDGSLREQESFYIIKVIKGQGTISYNEERFDAKIGSEFFIPHGTGRVEVQGDFEVMLFFPPLR